MLGIPRTTERTCCGDLLLAMIPPHALAMKIAFGWVAFLLFLLFAAVALGAPCEHVGELLKHDHMDLGVRLESRNPQVVREFKHALNFWSKILDMEWHEDLNITCSIDLVDGNPDFINGTSAVLTHRKAIARGVQSSGIVAIDSTYELTPPEWYAIAVHELGHLFGLRHNPSVNSVMYYRSVPGDQALDVADITALSALHRMRISLNWLQP